MALLPLLAGGGFAAPGQQHITPAMRSKLQTRRPNPQGAAAAGPSAAVSRPAGRGPEEGARDLQAAAPRAGVKQQGPGGGRPRRCCWQGCRTAGRKGEAARQGLQVSYYPCCFQGWGSLTRLPPDRFGPEPCACPFTCSGHAAGMQPPGCTAPHPRPLQDNCPQPVRLPTYPFERNSKVDRTVRHPWPPSPCLLLSRISKAPHCFAHP